MNNKRFLYILMWLGYIGFSMPAFPFLSITVMLFSIPLAMLGGWLYGYKGALATTAITIPYHYLMLNIHSNDPAVIIEAFNPFGIGSLILFSLSTALLQSLRQRYQKLNNELESIVAARTRDLRKLTDHLLEMQFIDRAVITSGLLDNPLQGLESMQENSSRLCAYLEEKGHQEKTNAGIVHEHIRQCRENLKNFMSDAEDIPEGGATLSEYVAKLSQKMVRLSGGELKITLDGKCDDFDGEVTYQLNSIINEAVTNAIRHAKATEIIVQCRQTAAGATICVENDGEKLPDRYQEGMGLPLMRHRAMSIGGRISIESGADQRTRLICSFPRTATTDEKAFPGSGQRLNTTA